MSAGVQASRKHLQQSVSGPAASDKEEEEISRTSVPDAGDAMWYIYRQDFRDVLLRKLVSEEEEGEPIKIFYGSEVTSVYPEGVVEFADGKSVECDLIIGK